MMKALDRRRWSRGIVCSRTEIHHGRVPPGRSALERPEAVVRRLHLLLHEVGEDGLVGAVLGDARVHRSDLRAQLRGGGARAAVVRAAAREVDCDVCGNAAHPVSARPAGVEAARGEEVDAHAVVEREPEAAAAQRLDGRRRRVHLALWEHGQAAQIGAAEVRLDAALRRGHARLVHGEGACRARRKVHLDVADAPADGPQQREAQEVRGHKDARPPQHGPRHERHERDYVEERRVVHDEEDFVRLTGAVRSAQLGLERGDGGGRPCRLPDPDPGRTEQQRAAPTLLHEPQADALARPPRDDAVAQEQERRSDQGDQGRRH
mmetsp:Transcript_22495/g.76058  ORF Transcript_22495/g.76058 Transcript_22495/m.76058 type:complete len:321 (-) Transcript_22495:59-1021(-)